MLRGTRPRRVSVVIEKVCILTYVFVKGVITVSAEDVSPVRLMSKGEQTFNAQGRGPGCAGGNLEFDKQAFTDADTQLE